MAAIAKGVSLNLDGGKREWQGFVPNHSPRGRAQSGHDLDTNRLLNHGVVCAVQCLVDDRVSLDA